MLCTLHDECVNFAASVVSVADVLLAGFFFLLLLYIRFLRLHNYDMCPVGHFIDSQIDTRIAKHDCRYECRFELQIVTCRILTAGYFF